MLMCVCACGKLFVIGEAMVVLMMMMVDVWL